MQAQTVLLDKTRMATCSNKTSCPGCGERGCLDGTLLTQEYVSSINSGAVQYECPVPYAPKIRLQ